MPIELNGQTVGDITLNGNTIGEVTVNGTVVYTSGPNLPISYSNLVAWYPFDAATYGGSNTDDVTAIIGGSGNDSAFDLINDNASYNSTAGVTDINAGSNSGAYDYSVSVLSTSLPSSLNSFSICFWVKWDTYNDRWDPAFDTFEPNSQHQFTFHRESGNDPNQALITKAGRIVLPVPDTGEFYHYAGTYDGSTTRAYVDGILEGSVSGSYNADLSEVGLGGRYQRPDSGFDLVGNIDDFRMYDKELTQSEIQTIISNTQP